MKTEFGKISAEAYWQDWRVAGKTGRHQIPWGGEQEFEAAFAQTKDQQSSSAAGKAFSKEELQQAYNSMSFKRANVIKAYEDEALDAETDLEEKDTGKTTEKPAEDPEEAQTETDIIVKPDGSRVLVITMNVGGMETTMSLKISEPTDMPNDSAIKEEELHNDTETMWREGIGAGEAEG